MSKQEYNRKIISRLNELVERCPDLRFGQLLWNCGILYWEDIDVHKIHDPYNDQSKTILNRMKYY